MIKKIWRALQFRLSSALVMMVVASIIVGLNLQPVQAEPGESAVPLLKPSLRLEQFTGWPFAMSVYQPFYG